MHRIHGPLLVMLTFGCAWLAWYGPGWVGLAPLALLSWVFARSRVTAFAIAAAYYAVTYACLPGTMDGFFHGAKPLQSHALVGTLVVAFAFVWAVLWSRQPSWWRVLLLLVLLSFPPLGLAHLWTPLFGVGAWFPGTGLPGLAVFSFLLAMLRYRPRAVATAAVLAAAGAHAAYQPTSPPDGWVAMDTDVTTAGYAAPALGFADEMRQFALIEDMVREIEDRDVRVLVMPESHLGGVVKPALDFFSHDWQRLRENRRTIVTGLATKIDGRNINAVAGYGASPFLWEQRVPALGAMWRPWDQDEHFPMRFAAPHLQLIDGRLTTIAICFEAGILWPLLASQAHGPDAYIAVGNLSWGRSTNLNRQGRLAVAAWAQLAGLPHLVAINN